MHRLLFIHTNGIKYEIKGPKLKAIRLKCDAEGITAINGWTDITYRP
jgi:hypothetical protein